MLPAAQRAGQLRLRITVLDDSREQQCAGSCGLGWASPESWGFLQERLRERFEGAVKLDYVDLAEPDVDSCYHGLVEQIRASNLVLPVIAFDGAIRLAGSVDYRTLVEAIEMEWEVRRGTGV